MPETIYPSVTTPEWWTSSASDFGLTGKDARKWNAMKTSQAKLEAAFPPAPITGYVSSPQQTSTNRTLLRGLTPDLAVSGAMGAAQLGLQLAGTAQDRYNKERIAVGQQTIAKGRIDENTAQAKAIEAESLARQGEAAARATEGRQRAEAVQASAGNTASAAAALQPAREAARSASADMLAVGRERMGARLAEADRQLKEYEERLAYKSQRQGEKRAAVMSTLGGLSGVFGEVRANKAMQDLDLSKISHLPKDQQEQIIKYAMQAKTPQDVARLEMFLRGQAPR